MVEATPPNVIILDLLMPELSGFEFLERLRQTARGRAIPVIVWTVKDLSEEERRRLRRVGPGHRPQEPGRHERAAR